MINEETSRENGGYSHAKTEGKQIFSEQSRKKIRYTDTQVREMLRQLKEEYEEITGAQKDRIVSLRENLETVNRELEDAHKERVDIACALLNARRCADAMISDAKEDCVRMLRDAKRRRDELREQITMYELTLMSIRSVAKNILGDVDGAERSSPLTLLQNDGKSGGKVARSS